MKYLLLNFHELKILFHWLAISIGLIKFFKYHLRYNLIGKEKHQFQKLI